MPETGADVVLHIGKKLDKLPPIPYESCIFRVHDSLRNQNEKAYEPGVVPIGPYHHGKKNLQPMEEHKLRYLQQLLQRRNETTVERYIVAMRESEERARKFYAEPISLDSNEFVEMMLLDSCFIVEFLRKCEMANLIDPNDRIFQLGHITYGLCRDLMLFENQLPFFIVMQLFNMTQNSTDSLDDLIRMFVRLFDQETPGENPREDDIEHLLGLRHYCCCYQFHSIVSQRDPAKTKDPSETKYPSQTKDMSLNSAKELQVAGINFKKSEGQNLFNIRFVNGTMEIPTLTIDDDIESFFRNLIAYEQYLPHTSWNYFTAYHKFMDYIVNTSEDVRIHTHNGIIHNLLGDNEVAAVMINKLSTNIIASYVGYEEVYDNVNKHCREKWNLR
ncbi:UPF0481 protein [Camellia lanceoleosa]|uniref:UPF0481 protein n=1 Tax=Camellia lanceoleosa TaxID=1840588 RepID=A0ACC0HHB8_9ERIC|nr:UPF0481 protein [Camellia lanceoleosa]